MKLLTWGMAMAASMGLGLLTVQGQEGATTNAAPEAATQVVAAASAPASVSEWIGFVRVLKDPKGEVSAIRFVTGERLLAVELNQKGRELAQQSRTQKFLVSGSLQERDGRPWLTITGFKNATEEAAQAPAPAAETNSPAASAPSTNSPVALPATNAPPAP